MKLQFNNREELERFFEHDVLTTAQAMEIIEVNRSRMSALVKEGKLKPIKEGRSSNLFLRSDIEEKKKELEQLRKKYRPYDS